MANRIALIGVHGIELKLGRNWLAPWARCVEQALGEPVAQQYPITWDHLNPRQRGWFWKLFGDSGGLGNPKVQDFMDQELGDTCRLCANDGFEPLIVAHSLGTLLVHQSLLRQPQHGVRLVTIGSPCRLRNINGLSVRPLGIRYWLNVYSPWLDVVVLGGRMSGANPVLSSASRNVKVHCRHPALSYLKRAATQRAIRAAVE